MLPEFLLPEITIREAGAGPELSLGDNAGETLIVTLGINRIVEQESLDVSIWGSADAIEWGARPLASFPQKFYCGVYQVMLDLSGRPDVKYLRAQWHASRWGKGEPKPLFDVYVFAQAMQPALAARG